MTIDLTLPTRRFTASISVDSKNPSEFSDRNGEICTLQERQNGYYLIEFVRDGFEMWVSADELDEVEDEA